MSAARSSHATEPALQIPASGPSVESQYSPLSQVSFGSHVPEAPHTTVSFCRFPAHASAPGGEHSSTRTDRACRARTRSAAFASRRASTVFRYTHRQPGVGAALIKIYDRDDWFRLYIVTSATEFTLPTVLGANILIAGERHLWTVETHGTPANVDAMAGPNGFMDPMSTGMGYPKGRRSGASTYTSAQGRGFIMAGGAE